MHALLILNEKNGNARIVVWVRDKSTRERLVSLIEENRGREAFDLLKNNAEFEAFLPAGTKLPFVPKVTLVEDLV